METMTQDHQWIRRTANNHRATRRALWTGRLLAGLVAAFLIVDSVGKLLEVQPVVEGSRQLGYPPQVVFSLGVILLTCVGVFLVPPTSALGGVLLTAYLGGAVATHVRVGSPLFTHVLFPTYLGAMLWASLVLRDPRFRVFLPWSGRTES